MSKKRLITYRIVSVGNVTDEMVKHISECNKLAQTELKTGNCTRDQNLSILTNGICRNQNQS